MWLETKWREVVKISGTIFIMSVENKGKQREVNAMCKLIPIYI